MIFQIFGTAEVQDWGLVSKQKDAIANKEVQLEAEQKNAKPDEKISMRF